MYRVITGPHLRCVQKESVFVQLVLEEDLDLELIIFQGEECLASFTYVRKIQLAPRLFFYMLTTKVTLCIHKLYHYDIKNKQNSIISELNLGLGECVGLPSFIFGNERILTGSCRQLSSLECDYLAKMLREFDVASNRPQMLILTGDQIYADDLSDDLLLKIIRLCAEYNLKSVSDFREQERHDTCRSAAFTTAKSSNLLLSLGEYIMMYLLSWSEELWASGDDFINYQDMRNVRKLFANVPVYMQMDDHDVSDDLKINNFWSKNINDLGTEILANAYVSGYIFQLMGNSHTPAPYEDLIVEFTDNKDKPTFELCTRIVDEADWSYCLTIADKNLLFLDTRNFRLGGNAPRIPAGLIKPSKITALLTGHEGKDLIIVSPSPVYGYEPIERLQSFMSFLPQSVSLIDREGWHAPSPSSAESESFKALEYQLSISKARRIIVLSGDVHYSFIRQIELPEVAVVQLVVSALKNKPPLTFLARLGFDLYNRFSNNSKYLRSSQGNKVLHQSNYCFLKLESEITISMYSSEIEHKFNLDT